jgi:hypothetical protein
MSELEVGGLLLAGGTVKIRRLGAVVLCAISRVAHRQV